MVETWVRPNRRVLLLGMAAPAACALAGLLLAWTFSGQHPFFVITGAGLVVLGVVLLVALAWQLSRPRVARDAGHLLFYLRMGEPVRVPLGVVECFFVGQSPGLLPGAKHRDAETASLVVRLAERAREWSARDVNRSLGSWCEGYITIRGTWCERLDIELVEGLNRRLAEACENEVSS